MVDCWLFVVFLCLFLSNNPVKSISSQGGDKEQHTLLTNARCISWDANIGSTASFRSNVGVAPHRAASSKSRSNTDWMVMRKHAAPPESWRVFIIIQVPSGYTLRVGAAGPSVWWLAGLPGGPPLSESRRNVTQIQSQRCPLTPGFGSAPVSVGKNLPWEM